MAVVLMTDNHVYNIEQQALTSFLVLVVVGLTSLLLLAANFVQGKIGEYGITVISKIMGLILASYYRTKYSKRFFCARQLKD